MSNRPRRPTPRQTSRVSLAALRPVRYPRRWALAAAALLALAAVLIVRFAPRGRPGPAGLRSLAPPERRAPRGAAVVFADFAGADACAECHQAQYDAWRGSTHARAGAAPPGEAVIAPFNGTPLRFRDAVVTPARSPDGTPQFTVAQPGRPPLTLTVAAVVGGGHMVGGGTQSFWTRAADGTWRFLPFDWSATARVWFCNTNGRLDRGWVPITPALALADCGDWPPHRVLGGHDRLETCQQCHGSQIVATWDPGAKHTDTRFTTLAVNCESCHGPGERHVQLARAERLNEDIGLPSLVPLDKDASLEVCFRCHALKEQLAPGYLPGEDFAAHFALGLPILAARPHFPDGRIRLFAYQEQHRWSDCYLNGGMTCVSCHDPHGQGYWDVNRAALVGRFDDRQCTSCHPSKAEAPERHTFHRPDSTGSRCVACHMPYLQEPNTGARVPYARSDHTIPIPRPGFDQELGIEDACRKCHRNLSEEELARQTERWWGTLKPHAPLVAGLLNADRSTTRLAEARLLLADSAGAARHAVGQFQGLAHFFLHRLAPDLADLEPEIVAQLESLTTAPDLDVRALALASLHLAAGEARAVRGLLEHRLREAGRTGTDGPLRARWAWVLTFRGDAYLAQRDPARALSAYRKAWEVRPDDPVTLRNLGAGYANTGDYRRAVDVLRSSLARDTTASATWITLAFALTQTGDWDGARTAYARAAAADPWDPAPHLSLGNAYARRNDPLAAAREWERALALDPSLAVAEFSLAGAYLQMGRRDVALAAVRRGLQFDPANPAGQRLLAQLTP